jgi:3,4-dihydroxy 2-butanone 4-phosphate synthase/GTP cyclohydrolase II
MIVYATTIEYSEHIVLVKGDPTGDEPLLVRMHQVDIIDNLMLGPRWQVSHSAMRMIAKAGRGVVVILRESQPTLVSDRVKRLEAHMPPPTDIRDNGVGAQILTDLGVKKLILLSNTRQHVIGLEGYGIEVVDRREVDLRPSAAAA